MTHGCCAFEHQSQNPKTDSSCFLTTEQWKQGDVSVWFILKLKVVLIPHNNTTDMNLVCCNVDHLYYHILYRWVSPARGCPETKTSAWTQLSQEATLYILSKKKTENTHSKLATALTKRLMDVLSRNKSADEAVSYSYARNMRACCHWKSISVRLTRALSPCKTGAVVT